MKKILAILLLLALVFTVAACQPKTDGPATEPSEEEIELKDLFTQILEKSGNEEMLGDSFMFDPVNQEEAGWLIGAESIDGSFEEGYALQPMINVHPFAMGMFRLAAGEDAESFASELSSKADLRKWICVGADAMTAATKGQTVLFVMGSPDEVSSLLDASGFTPVS